MPPRPRLRVASAKAKLTAEHDRVHLLEAQEAGALAALNQAQAMLKLAEIDLANTVVRAAISGTVGNWQVRVGRYMQPGMQLLAIVPLADAYVVANYKETQLDHMQVGQRVDMEVDSYPGRTFTGRVSSLSPASGAQFALLPPDNATGNFTKVVQRIPVKIIGRSQWRCPPASFVLACRSSPGSIRGRQCTAAQPQRAYADLRACSTEVSER